LRDEGGFSSVDTPSSAIWDSHPYGQPVARVAEDDLPSPCR